MIATIASCFVNPMAIESAPPVTLPIQSTDAFVSRDFRRMRWLLLLAAAFLLWNLSYAPFWSPDEGRYASASLEMAHPLNATAADWVVPHLNTVPRLNKPPLVYWLGAIAFRLLGPSEAAGRLVPALASIGVLLIVWRMASLMFGERAGIISALVWATTVLPFSLGRVLNTDMLLTFGIALTQWGLWQAINRQSKALNYSAWLICGIGFAVSMLAKGPVGVALPVGISFVYLCVVKDWRQISVPGLVLSLVLMAIIALPWYLLVEQRQPGFLHQFLLQENLGRFSGSKDYHDATPVFFYLPVLLIGLMPWTGFLLPLLAQKRALDATSAQRLPRIFLMLWAGLLIVFFSLSHTKLVSYILPAFPPLSMLIGEALDGWDSTARWAQRSARCLNLVLYLTLIAGTAVMLLGNKTLPRTEGMPWFIALTVILIAACVVLMWQWNRNSKGWHIALSQAGMGVALFVMLLSLAGHIALYVEPSPMLRALRPYLSPADHFVQVNTFQPTAPYDLQRPSLVVNFMNNAGLDDASLKNSKWFVHDQGDVIQHELNNQERTFVLLKWKSWQSKPWPATAYLIARNNEYMILSNRPAPSGFDYNFTSPARQQAFATLSK